MIAWYWLRDNSRMPSEMKLLEIVNLFIPRKEEESGITNMAKLENC